MYVIKEFSRDNHDCIIDLIMFDYFRFASELVNSFKDENRVFKFYEVGYDKQTFKLIEFLILDSEESRFIE